MRNLHEHPITQQEVLTVLDTVIQRAQSDEAIGSIDSFVLCKIYDKFAECFMASDFDDERY